MVLSFLLSSCGFPESPLRVKLLLPENPWQEEGLAVYHRLRFPDVDKAGTVREMIVPAGVRAVYVELPRELILPVSARAFGRTKAVGAVLNPQEHRGGVMIRWVELSHRAGAAAELLLDIWPQYRRLRTLNVPAMLDAMVETGGGDPWTCDMERIKHAILTGTLNRLSIRTLPRFDFVLSLPAEDWVAESPLWGGAVRVLAERDGRFDIRFEGVVPGDHRFFSPRMGLELFVQIDKNGDCRFMLDSPLSY